MTRIKRGARQTPEVDQQLIDAVATLDRSGAVKWFYTVRRRKPPSSLWQYYKRDIPIDDVTDLRALCAEGGEDYEYRIRVHDQNHNKAVGPDGTVIEDRVIPATEGAPSSSPSASAVVLGDDPILNDRLKELTQRRQEMEIRRREIALMREEERLARLEQGAEEEVVYEDPGAQGMIPLGQQNMPPWMRGMGGWVPPPWAQTRDTSSDMIKLVTAIIAAQSAHKPDNSSLELMKIMLPLVAAGKSNGLEPKDMLGFVSPIVASLAGAQAEASKMMLQSMADSDNIWKEKVLNMAKLEGADDDQVEKLRRVLSTVGDIGVNVIRQIKGGAPQKKVEVPVLRKTPAPGALPAPAPAQGEAAPAANPEPVFDPIAEARKATVGRVEIFLLAHEQEMLAESDPGWVVDKCEEALLSLPASLRKVMETGKVAEVYNALRVYKPDLVDRIFKHIEADTTGKMKEWCNEFWEIVQEPDDQGDDQGDGQSDGQDEQPEPETQPGGDGAAGKE